MSICEKCKEGIKQEEAVFICPDCGVEYHDRCHNLTDGICPMCTMFGVNPIKQIEKMQFTDKKQIRSLDPKQPELDFEHIDEGGDINQQFEKAAKEEQIERINEAIETAPRALVSTSPEAKGKEWFVAFPLLIAVYFGYQGIAYGDPVGIIVAVVIGLATAVWWAKY